MFVIKCMKQTNDNNGGFFFPLPIMLAHQFVLSSESENLAFLFIMVQINILPLIWNGFAWVTTINIIRINFTLIN